MRVSGSVSTHACNPSFLVTGKGSCSNVMFCTAMALFLCTPQHCNGRSFDPVMTWRNMPCSRYVILVSSIQGFASIPPPPPPPPPHLKRLVLFPGSLSLSLKRKRECGNILGGRGGKAVDFRIFQYQSDYRTKHVTRDYFVRVYLHCCANARSVDSEIKIEGHSTTQRLVKAVDRCARVIGLSSH